MDSFTLKARLKIHKNEKARCGDLRFYGTTIMAVDEMWKMPKAYRTKHFPDLESL